MEALDDSGDSFQLLVQMADQRFRVGVSQAVHFFVPKHNEEVTRFLRRCLGAFDIPDVEAPNLDLVRYPRLAGARAYEVVLEPGEIIFMPLAWWHQVKSLDFSVTVTYTNFLWPNDAHADYPS